MTVRSFRFKCTFRLIIKASNVRCNIKQHFKKETHFEQYQPSTRCDLILYKHLIKETTAMKI
ncbi:CLUMA_CG018452, isoform A [Clunio marinus]|uniref:CLUMA_CG018452, isoform A n=1 Tax=Clunio marinus TaxID=568069 RepID=A0A1J1IZ31_9DIPT|nr:CLUMA_CG018452, isoform A [Clunio marinus]